MLVGNDVEGDTVGVQVGDTEGVIVGEVDGASVGDVVGAHVRPHSQHVRPQRGNPERKSEQQPSESAGLALFSTT